MGGGALVSIPLATTSCSKKDKPEDAIKNGEFGFSTELSGALLKNTYHDYESTYIFNIAVESPFVSEIEWDLTSKHGITMNMAKGKALPRIELPAGLNTTEGKKEFDFLLTATLIKQDYEKQTVTQTINFTVYGTDDSSDLLTFANDAASYSPKYTLIDPANPIFYTVATNSGKTAMHLWDGTRNVDSINYGGQLTTPNVDGLRVSMAIIEPTLLINILINSYTTSYFWLIGDNETIQIKDGGFNSSYGFPTTGTKTGTFKVSITLSAPLYETRTYTSSEFTVTFRGISA